MRLIINLLRFVVFGTLIGNRTSGLLINNKNVRMKIFCILYVSLSLCGCIRTGKTNSSENNMSENTSSENNVTANDLTANQFNTLMQNILDSEDYDLEQISSLWGYSPRYIIEDLEEEIYIYLYPVIRNNSFRDDLQEYNSAILTYIETNKQIKLSHSLFSSIVISYKSLRFEMGIDGDSTYFILEDNFRLEENQGVEIKREILLLLKKHFKMWE